MTACGAIRVIMSSVSGGRRVNHHPEPHSEGRRLPGKGPQHAVRLSLRLQGGRRAARAADSAASPALRYRFPLRRANSASRLARQARGPEGRRRREEQSTGMRPPPQVRICVPAPARSLSASTGTRQGRLRRPFGQTLDRTRPRVADSAAIGSWARMGQSHCQPQLILNRQSPHREFWHLGVRLWPALT